MPEKKEIVHNSQDAAYRSPGGAVVAKTRVRLRLDLELKQKVSSVMLRLWRDNVGESLINMKREMLGDNRFRYACEIDMPEKGCLLWYYFIIVSETKTFFYGNNMENLGGEGKIYDQDPPSYQITVFNEGAVTPDWFKHAVMYQIFPDRFYRSGDVSAVKKDAVIHSSWENTPFYFKDVDTKEIVSYDFFGGNIAGMIEKLPYLQELGISAIYLNPVFEAASNHRYDTGDYHKIDPLLGTNELFSEFCRKAAEFGIRVILDGVFSHTGSDSKYFNREGSYDSIGAFQSADSPYYDWYAFKQHPGEYESWWGFTTLPNVKETTASYMNFIINDDDSVLKYWLKQGISGWRLDVIDELPAAFSQRFFQVLKEENPEAVLIGEVWEDASNKISYGSPREYLCGQEMDSAMNYPFRRIVLDFALGHADAHETHRKIMSLAENYPKQNFYAMMNLIGSHDVERVLTLLGEAPFYDGMPAIQQARFCLSNEQYQLAAARLKVLSLWQMTFPGVPSIYYGDEAGMQGFRDPYNRGAFVWGKEDQYLQSWYKKIIGLRNRYCALRTGEFIPLIHQGDVYGYARRIFGGKDAFGKSAEDDVFLILMNRSRAETHEAVIEARGLCQGEMEDMLGNANDVTVCDGKITVTLHPLQAVVLRQAVQSKLARGAGVLMHPTSLPSKYGIGDLGKGAYEFVNFLAKGRQTYWQILPLNPVGYGYSPYQSPSAFAGNPMLISIGKLVLDGLMSAKEAKIADCPEGESLGFAEAWAHKEKCLRIAYKKFLARPAPGEYKAFCAEHEHWLEDYALFMALKKEFEDAPWNCWESGLAARDRVVMEKYRKNLAQEIGYQKFLQYEFFKQWSALKSYANQRGIRIIGDMPIFVAHDSADVWSNQELFALKKDGSAEKVAGVPPDYFSATGQLWGNPHYLWDEMKKDDFAWWRRRFAVLLEMADVIRVDHFRGFEAYWEVDGSAENAIDGTWVKGPGAHFFRVIEKYFGQIPIIAEDLGIITDEVNDLKDAFSFPGMKVLHFALSPDERDRIEFLCEANCVVYTGTHDNNTTIGWMKEDLDERMKTALAKYLQVERIDQDLPEACWRLITSAYASNGAAVIIPMQDLLALDGSARMNHPGTVGENWQWRAPKDACSEALCKRLSALCKRFKR